VTDRDTETFVEQVEEEVRRERWAKFWKKWGLWIGGGVGAVILGVAGWEVAQTLSTGQTAASSQAYFAAQRALDADKTAAKTQFTALSETGAGAYRSAALIERAALLQEAGDLQSALTAFDEAARLAQDQGFKRSLELRAAYLAADLEGLDAIQARLQPIIAAEGSYALLARQLLAVEAAEAGNTALAIEQLTALTAAIDDLTVQLPAADERLPPNAFSLKNWAEGLLSVLRPMAAESATTPPPAAPSASPAPAPATAPASGEKK
jgi:hypothetical protein